jgi:hypothetical protein
MNNDNRAEKISHETHMNNLFLRGILYSSLSFVEMALVMSRFGLETTENEAMDAYDNLVLLGYPRGGIPSAWNLGPIGDRSPNSIEYSECKFMSCNNSVEVNGNLCAECQILDDTVNNWILINHEYENELLISSSWQESSGKCHCGVKHTKFNCTLCLMPLCTSCMPRKVTNGTLMLQHYECLNQHQQQKFDSA